MPGVYGVPRCDISVQMRRLKYNQAKAKGEEENE